MTDLTPIGYAGKILRVDLSSGKTWTEDLDEPKKAFESVAKNALKIVEANPKDLDTILLAALPANYLEDYQSVNQYLTRTNNLPLDRNMRQRIDSAFLLNAFKFEDQQDLEIQE